MGTMRIQDRSGDTEMTWDKADSGSVEAAKAIFAGLMVKGHMAYKTDKKGGGEVIKAFDPAADDIVVTVPLAGG